MRLELKIRHWQDILHVTFYRLHIRYPHHCPTRTTQLVRPKIERGEQWEIDVSKCLVPDVTALPIDDFRLVTLQRIGKRVICLTYPLSRGARSTSSWHTIATVRPLWSQDNSLSRHASFPMLEDTLLVPKSQIQNLQYVSGLVIFLSAQ